MLLRTSNTCNSILTAVVAVIDIVLQGRTVALCQTIHSTGMCNTWYCIVGFCYRTHVVVAVVVVVLALINWHNRVRGHRTGSSHSVCCLHIKPLFLPNDISTSGV